MMSSKDKDLMIHSEKEKDAIILMRMKELFSAAFDADRAYKEKNGNKKIFEQFRTIQAIIDRLTELLNI